ncbi:MAG: rod shape-determining protein MreD [Ignavibacteria bacterium]|nr:rod shape-determining protein MreD [Ignavibacteria bacterium]
MSNRYFLPVFVLSVLLILQLTLVELISYENFKPDLLLIGLIYYTLKFGQIEGIVSAFVFGLLFDLLSNGVIGASSISKVIATFIAGYFADTENNRVEISTNLFAIIFFVALVERITYILVAVNLDFKSLLIVLVQFGLIPAAVTLVFSLFILLMPRETELR